MNENEPGYVGIIVEEELHMSLDQLCKACGTDRDQLAALIVEGAIEPSGAWPGEWQFSGNTLRRARTAVRLTRDLGVNAAGVALVLDLLDEISALRARLGA